MSSYNVIDYEKGVRKAAHRVVRCYNKFDREDIEQAIILDMMEHPKRYRTLRGRLLDRAMQKAGHQYCRRELIDYLHFSDQYTYSSEEIRALLKKFYQHGSNVQQPRIESFTSFEEFRDAFHEWERDSELWIDFIDLKTGLSKLRDAQLQLIEKKFAHEVRLSKAERNRLSDALWWLTYLVNEKGGTDRTRRDRHTGPGARQAIRNGRAAAITAHQ